MKPLASWYTILHLLTCILCASADQQSSKCKPHEVDVKPRVFILSDISNEPDDAQSFVRLLLHADQYSIEGLVATTSYWLNYTTVPEQIVDVVNNYGRAVDNLQVHGNGEFPDAESLLQLVKSGPTTYGMAAVTDFDDTGLISEGAQLLIDAVDASEEPLYVQLWGGANTLAEALRCIQKTRSRLNLEKFTEKVRVYSISDQDNAGAWIRREFPSIRYVVSIHGWNQYGLATWSGISGEKFYGFDIGGPDTNLVSNGWVDNNIRNTPLGKSYPPIMFIMEGDSPAILFTMQNGLNSPEHPEWGGWGGRYALSSHQGRHYGDTADRVVGKSGQTYVSNHATLWRWREAYQNEFAARMQWILYNTIDEKTTHPPVVVVNGSCGSHAIELDVEAGTSITLDASDSYDPDTGNLDTLHFNWWQYREITATQWQVAYEVPELSVQSTSAVKGQKAVIEIPPAKVSCLARRALHMDKAVQPTCQEYHVILEVKNSGIRQLTRYRRVILRVKLPVEAEGRDADHDEL